MRGVSLLDRTRGACAERVRRDLDSSMGGRVADLESEVRALRRMLVMDVRTPLGLMIKDDRYPVTFNNKTRRIRFQSSDSSVTMERNPNVGDIVDFRVNAYTQICCDRGDTVDSSGADDLAIVGNDAAILRAQTIGAEGSPDRVGIQIEAPYTAGVVESTGWVLGLDAAGGTVKYLVLKDGTAAPSDDFDCGST